MCDFLPYFYDFSPIGAIIKQITHSSSVFRDFFAGVYTKIAPKITQDTTIRRSSKLEFFSILKIRISTTRMARLLLQAHES